MRVQGYTQFGGGHSMTAWLKNALHSQGVVAPHTGAPFSEAMLLGLAGGIGGGYWVFEFAGTPSVMLGFRHDWQRIGSADVPAKVCARLGASARVHETGSAKTAAAELVETLRGGLPALVWADMACLPYMLLPAEMRKYYLNVVGVAGIDEARGVAEIDDRAAVPLVVPLEALAAARAMQPRQKHRLLSFAPPPPVERAALVAAVQESLQECVRGLTAPPIQNFGLPAFEKWAALITDPKDKKGWPQVFPSGRHLFGALRWVYELVETFDSPGAGFRSLYADFLDEASAATGRGALRDVAAQYRALGTEWRDLAAAALPESVPPLRQTRELLARRYHVFRDLGDASQPEREQIVRRLAAVAAEMDAAFPLEEQDVRTLLDELHGRLVAIVAAERKAVTALQHAIA